MSEQSPEIFDDLYLGLQAGGALRKQRRGEELTEQEQAALGHWQRLSVWRKAVAVGAFALGTFGLGFTLGGLDLRPPEDDAMKERIAIILRRSRFCRLRLILKRGTYGSL